MAGMVPVLEGKPFGRLTRTQLEGWMRLADVPAVSVVSVAGGKAAFLQGGAATAETIFAAASLSKQVTAYAVLALARAGRWDLDKPLGDYVALEGSPEAGRVTARMALSHSTGFPNWRFEAGAALAPDAVPGKTFRYSGEGYVYMQRVMEKITGVPFGRHVRETVFAPLGMGASTFGWRTPAERTAAGHDGQGVRRNSEKDNAALDAFAAKACEEWTCEDCAAFLRETKRRVLTTNYAINAAASLKTSATDYARFLVTAMGVAQFGEKLVSFSGGAGTALGWGLGWGVETFDGRTFWWQWGDNPGYKNIVFVEPGRRAAVAVFTNGDKGGAVYRRAVAAMHGVDHPAFVWL